MKNNFTRYTLRINTDLFNKLGYIAKCEVRSKNKEIEQLIKMRVLEFEKINGKIDLSKIKDI